ncbi:hypothetical protein FSARC_2751 [Fusarium sarcochroum]|uniref:N-acetyltransferase ESCO zinc-finger domain-containing protein n=1 Tax=Fusarium sarcochroum TaxID=1208366 RepID=A0A8H4U5X1_9HYPO|nr:hypothetical protein FSARC_2751 [Fusarium sarcochroum]
MTPSILEALATVEPPETPQVEAHDDEKTEESSQPAKEPSLDDPQLGKPISHGQIVDLWKRLKAQGNSSYTLEQLLRGASVYIPPPPLKPEPSPQYKALMARLRHDEEARSYERMINPSPRQETFKDRFPHSAAAFAEVNRPTSAADIGDEDIAMEEVRKQVTLIINFLVSIAGVAGTLSESPVPSQSRSRAKPLRTYGKRSLLREDSPSIKKRRISTEATTSGMSESRNTETESTSLPKIVTEESKDTPVPATATSKPIANPIKKGSILSFFKPIPPSSTVASSPKSDEPQPEATPPSSPPQPPRIETRKKPRLLRFRGNSIPLLDSEDAEDDNKGEGETKAEEESGTKLARPALRESSLNRESSTSDTKPTKKAKPKSSTVQTTLNLSSQAAFSECKVCNTVWNPLYPDDVKFHTKQHAAVLRAKRKEKENEL